MGLLVSAVGGGFKNFRRERNLKKIIFHWAGKVEALLQFLVFALACANCQCAYTCEIAYFQIKIIIPVKIKAAPAKSFPVIGSFKMMKESKSVTTMLALSIDAT